MSNPSAQVTKAGSLLAVVWVASCLAAWSMQLDPNEMGLVLITILFFRFVPMIAAVGALFGRPIFGAALGVVTLFALVGIEMANVLIAGV